MSAPWPGLQRRGPCRETGARHCGIRPRVERLRAVPPSGLVRRLLVAALLLLSACDEGAQLSIVSHGVERLAWIDRPERPRVQRRPLLVVLHAAMFSGGLARDELELLDRARDAGVALAFPDAERLVWNDGSLSRSLPGALSSAADDVEFLDALIDRLIADGTADPAAIHLAGVSSGGMMALHYACARAQRLSSVAVFLATMPPDAERTCHPARPLNILMVAGTADPVVRWTGEVALGGLATLQQRLSVPDSFAFWRRVNHCADVAPARRLPRHGDDGDPDVLVHVALGCAGRVGTVLYEVRGGGHRVSVGDDWTLLRLLGRATPDFDPGALLLDFALDPASLSRPAQADRVPSGAGGRRACAC